MQYGSFDYIERTVGKGELAAKCHNYFTEMLERMEFDNMTFKSTLDCVRYVNFDKPLESKVVLLCNTLLQVSPLILNVLITTASHLIHSTLNESETVLLYRHFTEFSGAKYLESTQDGFITLPSGLIHAHGISQPIPIFLNSKRFDAFVYRAHMLSAIFIIDSQTAQPDAGIFRRLDEILYPNLSTLQPFVQKMTSKKIAATKYFDHLLINKSLGKLDQIGEFKNSNAKVNAVLAEIKHELDVGLATEISMKTTDDAWLSGRNVGQAQLFTAIHQKRDAAIGDLETEFNKVKQSRISPLL